MRAQPAIDHALANPDLSTAVIGAASLMQLDEALATLETGPLPGSALAEVER
jgi:aryl-alcohol dehydrogenase-like predicted oxidoreductase